MPFGRIKRAKKIVATPGHTAIGMAIGDSFTQGAPGLVGGFRAPIFAANPGLEFVGSQSSVGYHEGYNGYRIDQISPATLPVVAVLNPQIIVLLAGANDIAQGETPAATFTELQTFVAAIFAANASVAHILVGTIPVSNDPTNQNAYNALIMGATWTGNVTSVACSSTLVYPTDFTDATHPSTAGYQKMGAIWAPFVTALL